MSHVLYRKYRPKNFSEVIGQEHIVRTLTNALKENTVSHAYLFAGPRGTGKTTIARLLAKAINCQNRKSDEFEPCNQCDSCREINQGISLDLIEIDAASNRGIDEIRELKEGIRFSPVKAKYKVFIIDECHQLSKDAANALLKTLEEPPSHAIFILATTELHKMIATILSRCQKFDFHRINLEQIKERLKAILKKEKMAFEDEALEIITQQSGGSVRDAESLLDEVVSFAGRDGKIETAEVQKLLGLSDSQAIVGLIQNLSNNQTKEAMELVNSLHYSGVDLNEFIKETISYLREMMILRIDSTQQSPLLAGLSNEEKTQLKEISQKYSEKGLSAIIEKLMTAENKMKTASIIQLPLELSIVDICFRDEKPSPEAK